MTEVGTTLHAANRRLGSPGTLSIAEGTEFETIVYDVRKWGPWATESGGTPDPLTRQIIYHHTVENPWEGGGWEAQLRAMRKSRTTAPWGLPYNFIVFPGQRGRIWYLNDVDQCWPHTYDHNADTAIAAWGNYSIEAPTRRLVRTLLQLADALAVMWGRFVQESQHLDWTPTECPGHRLSPHLPQRWRQRSADDAPPAEVVTG